MAGLGFTFDPAIAIAVSNYGLAMALFDRGIRVFPCQQEGGDAKKPCPGVRWQSESTSRRPVVEGWWRRWPDAMPGIDLGKSGFLVVDADGVEGVAAWDLIAAENGGVDAPYVDTPGQGRHYYFRQPEGLNHGNGRGRLPKKDVCPIDIRGDGGYAIAPGSQREDGVYEPFDGDPLGFLDAPVMPGWLVDLLTTKAEPSVPPAYIAPVITPAAAAEHPRLRKYVEVTFDREVRNLASCGAGGRNNQLNTSAFALFQLAAAEWSGITEAQVEAALLGAAEQCGLIADDGEPSVRKTLWSAKRAAKAQPRPLPEHIASEIEEDDANRALGAKVARSLVMAHDGSVIDEETGEIINQVIETAISDTLPDHLTRVPGIVGQIVDWIEATARRPSRPLALGAALTVTGTIIGRRLCGPTRSATHLYVLTLAKTGAGKDHTLVQSERILAACGMSAAIGPDEFMSQTALINRLGQAPLTHSAMDEFGAWMATVNNPRSGPHVAGISKILRTAWGRSFAPMKTPEWASRSMETIQAPALSILGASTHDEFYAALKGRDVINGFLNRFLVLSSEVRPKDRDPDTDPKSVPDAIIDRAKAMFGGGNSLAGITGQFLAHANAEVTPIEVPWRNDQTRAIFRELQAYVEDLQDKHPTKSPFYARTAEMAIRMATIRAAGENLLKPSIGVEDMEWARDLAMWSAERLASGAELYMAETETQEITNQILRIVRVNGGVITKMDLTRAMQHRFKSRELDEAIKLLVEAGVINDEMVKTVGRPKRTLTLAR